jgi:transcriptional regulator with XRE-family HTH domain
LLPERKNPRRYPPNTHLRDAREARGWSAERAAEMLCRKAAELGGKFAGVRTNPRTVQRWEGGDRQPTPTHEDLICQLYEATREELGLVNRRAFLKAGAATLIAAPIVGVEALTDGAAIMAGSIAGKRQSDGGLHSAGSGRIGAIDRGQLDGLLALTRAYIDQMHTLAPANLLPQVRGHLTTLHRLIAHHQSTVGRDLLATTAEAEVVAARLSFSMGNYGDAINLYSEAEQLAIEAGDMDLRAYILGQSSHLHITGYEAGAHLPGDQYAEPYSRALGIPPAVPFGAGGEQDGLPLAAAADGLISWITSSNTTDEAIERIGQSALNLAGAHASQPPRTVLNDVMQAHRQVQALLHSGRQRLRQTRDLLRIDADLLAHASLLLDDLHHGTSAGAHGRAALQLAEEAGASQALAFSAQAKTARWRGMHSSGPARQRSFASSAGLARQGFDCCSPADPVRVLLACQEASAAALLGDAPLARQALRRAEDAAETAPSGEATAWSCPRPRLALYGLSVALRLNDPAAGLHSAHTASQLWEDGEPCLFGVWSLVQAGAGIAHVMNGDLTAAASQLGLVTLLPAGLRISTITGYLDDMDTELRDCRFAAAPQAASMREQIAAFSTPAMAGTTS